MPDGASVRVAVRVRPFNKREIEMNSVCCVKMASTSTILVHPETKKDRTFNFDFSYWSHDGYHEGPDGELIGDTPQYATQRKVYDDLGVDVLTNSYEGYNSTLFAYGQTGSGKSYSMVGYGVNRGIIPIVCEEMFKKVETVKDDPTLDYQVTVSMLEIYNEKIRDLLSPKPPPPGGLRIRSRPGIGVYVEDLVPIAVSSYEQIATRMDEGTSNRTVASTKMNATSSRAHTVFSIGFTTVATDVEHGISNEMKATMNLVDLAGSERANSTGATGDRLKEGSAINASLSALGNVISALADKAMGKKKVFVPYRNSALTRLLQDALGGNSKTIMIAALSPADVNYDETLGTLRYADRAKKIKNVVVKMENPTDKIIRMLKEENARLLKLMESKGIDTNAKGIDTDELKQKLEAENAAKLAAQMAENDRILAEMKKTWAQKLEEAKQLGPSSMESNGAASVRNLDQSKPYIVNLHEDPMLSEKVVYYLHQALTKVGTKTAAESQDIVLAGLSIERNHALIHNTENKVFIEALNDSKTFVNGDLVQGRVELHQGDRLILGNNYVFRFQHPDEESKEQIEVDEAWEQAMQEYREKNGVAGASGEERMKALQLEEAKKRRELEMKLRKMELRLQEQRDEAKAELEAMGSDANAEEIYKAKVRQLELDSAKRREMSERLLQEQMARRRETAKLEEELAKLVPLVNEANLMSEEMDKGVKFEARLQASKKANNSATNELNLDDIEPVIIMSSTSSSWTWSVVKFDSRLFMMREMYQEWMEDETLTVAKTKDPFWDPPEPQVIGKAFVYLKALAHLVEIENSCPIVDSHGRPQGSLLVDIYPEGPNGEDLEYLSNNVEVVGRSANFRILIPHAKGLPAEFSNDVFVSFSFGNELHETEACEIKTTDPKFKYEAIIKYDSISEEVRQYFLTEAAVFEVKGFTDAAAAEVMECLSNDNKFCHHCEDSTASLMCIDCTQKFCQACFKVMHKSSKKSRHKKKLLGVTESHVPKGNCFQCENNVATVTCVECDKALCQKCNASLHKSLKKAEHKRTPIEGVEQDMSGQGTVNRQVCEFCEEEPGISQCVDCKHTFCEDCDALMHKSARKRNHTRYPV